MSGCETRGFARNLEFGVGLGSGQTYLSLDAGLREKGSEFRMRTRVSRSVHRRLDYRLRKLGLQPRFPFSVVWGGESCCGVCLEVSATDFANAGLRVEAQ